MLLTSRTFLRIASAALLFAPFASPDAFAAEPVALVRDAAIGAAYGAPGPRRCASTTQPTKGAIGPAEARAYVICGAEGVTGSTLMLQAKVVVQVAKGRPYIHVTDSLQAIDTSQLVYDIRGTSVRYACAARGGVLPDSKLCTGTETPHDEGKCYRTTFGDWRCTWGDFTAPVSTDTRLNRAPPSESEAE
jgi:hypothetical protein